MTCIRKFDELGAAGGLAPTGDAPAQAADRRAAVRTLPGPMGAGQPGGRGRRRPIGDLVTVIGAGHTAIGLVGHRAALAGIARDGVIDAVRGRRDREEALWFLVSGAALLVTGRSRHGPSAGPARCPRRPVHCCWGSGRWVLRSSRSRGSGHYYRPESPRCGPRVGR